MLTNYYLILGVGPEANAAQIRRAYRQRARECHPDHDPAGNESFLQLKEAYQVLSNPIEKARYDRELQSQRPRPRHLQLRSPIDLLHDFGTYSPSLEEITDLFAQNFIPSRQPKTLHMRDLHVELPISSEESIRGAHVVLGVPTLQPCRVCEGTGKAGYYICDECGGVGADQVTAQVDVFVPRATADGTIIPVSLKHLGIRNMNLLLHVRVV